MTNKGETKNDKEFDDDDGDKYKVQCLVEQGFTPYNSSSMTISDGQRLLETSSQDDVRVSRCTRWEELQETVQYHAQLAALLEAPTKFILLNNPDGQFDCPQEMSIAERGPEWIQEDLEALQQNVQKISPGGVTPLTMHLQRIHRSIQHLHEKIVLVLATDGRPTDNFGYSSAEVDRAFENALREIQSKAWVVVRLCTNEESILEYYQRLDNQMELSLEVLDDYLGEAKEVYSHNPWLTYSLSLHRCREMGMSSHSLHRWLDWLDERLLTRAEIHHVLQILGLIHWNKSPHSLDSPEEWKDFCQSVDKEQKYQQSQRNEKNGQVLPAFSPWNPIRKRPTPWIDVAKLRRYDAKDSSLGISLVIAVMILAILLNFILDPTW